MTDIDGDGKIGQPREVDVQSVWCWGLFLMINLLYGENRKSLKRPEKDQKKTRALCTLVISEVPKSTKIDTNLGNLGKVIFQENYLDG